MTSKRTVHPDRLDSHRQRGSLNYFVQHMDLFIDPHLIAQTDTSAALNGIQGSKRIRDHGGDRGPVPSAVERKKPWVVYREDSGVRRAKTDIAVEALELVTRIHGAVVLERQ